MLGSAGTSTPTSDAPPQDDLDKQIALPASVTQSPEPASSQHKRKRSSDDVEITHTVEHPSDPAPKGPKKKTVPLKQGKGKELKILLSNMDELTPEQEWRSDTPIGLWEGLKTKLLRPKNPEMQHKGDMFCPFSNLTINDRAGFIRPARELVDHSILPRDEIALSKLGKDDLMDVAYLAAAAVSIYNYTFLLLFPGL